jgi:peptide/nickel transport system substrate-binding protein
MTRSWRDAANEVRPQMLESYRLDPSQRIYTMVLRPNLRFHDGSLVRVVDVVASLRRWALRDNAGVWLSRFGMQIAAVDERTFTIETPSPTRWCCSRCPRQPTRRSSCANATR